MAAPGENLQDQSADRLWDSLMEMAKIGPGVAGGNNRQTLTDADGEGRQLFKRWCEAAGLDARRRRRWARCSRRRDGRPIRTRCRSMSAAISTPSRPAASTTACSACSAALEVVRSLNDLGIRTRHPIVVTNWTNEEGARFAPAMLASGVFAGVHRPGLRLRAHRPRRQAVRRRAGADRLEGRRAGRRAQDARLSSSCTSSRGRSSRPRASEIGVVTHCQGLWWLRVHADRQGGAYRLDADAACGVNAGLGDGADHRDGAGGGDGRASRTRSAAVGQVKFYPELAQRAAGHGGLHRRHPLARPGEARRGCGRGSSARRRRSARRSASAARSSRSAISIRSPSTPELRRRGCAAPPSGSATRTATSSPAPATTPAGRRRWRRRRW